MKKWFMDKLEIILTIFICLIVLWMNFIMFTQEAKKSDTTINKVHITTQNTSTDRFNNIITSRSGENREIIIYKLIANDEILYFEDEEKALEYKNEILEKTDKLEINIEKEQKLINELEISSENDIIKTKKFLINKYKKISTCYPTKSKYISSKYGNRSLGWHRGIDIAGKYKDPIYAYKDGKVIEAKNSGSYGNMILIQHGDGIKTRYAHMSKILVKVGQNVNCGQKIGLMGSTGRSTGTHLHFEVIINNKNVNPYGYIF